MRSIVFVILILVCINSISQEYNYYHYDVKDGLSGITVYSIAQDKDGFLWLGTENGLSRFDGSNFKNYTSNDGLSANEIINLFVDSKNRVWIFPFKSSIYYYYQGKIHNVNNDTILRKFNLGDEIFDASEDKNGNIFFLEQRKLHILSPKNEVKEVEKINDKIFDVNGCGVDADGICNLYVSIRYTSVKDYRFYVYKYQNSRMALHSVFYDSSFLRNAMKVNAGYTVIKNGSVFQICSQKTRDSFNIKIPNRFHTISYITDSSFAISTFDKTFLYNIDSRKIVDSFLANKPVNRCFRDKEGNLWFATTTQGLYRLSSTNYKVYRFEDNQNYVPVYSLHAFNNHLFIGGSKNYLWDLKLNNNVLKKLNIGNEYTINSITQIQVNQNDLYIGSNIGIFKITDKEVSAYFKNIAIKSFFIHDSSIIIATNRAVYELPLNNLALYNSSYYDTIWRNRSTCADKINDKYYVGTLKSLYLVSDDSERSILDMGKSFPVLNDKIISIKTVTGNDAWIATESNGLIYIQNDKVVYQLTIKDGLPSNLCKCLYVSDNNIWVGTDKGVCKIDISGFPFSIRNFNTSEGLNSDIINCIYTNGDSVFAGTPFGLSVFTDSKIQQTSMCNLKLLNIQSKDYNWYSKQDSIRLSSKDNFLQFEYAGISFVSAGDVTYYYQLKGLNDIWQSTKQNILEFQSLGSGKYELNIYAVNKYGVKSEMLTVPFTKAKTFWQLLWVQILATIIVGIFVWLILKFRIEAVKKAANEKLMRERQINELEQMALRAQMNPHFIFNSLNSIQQYVFAGDVMEANEFITNFSSLVRQTLYISGKKFITLAEEVKYLDSYLQLEQAKYENMFRFQVISDENITENTQVPPLFIQPFIENSIRHGVLNLENGMGEILVHFYRNSNFLFCIVEDNGIGRENASRLRKRTDARHQSKGMELVQKRIESLNSIYNCEITVSVEDIIEENKTGTRVKIKLPLNYEE